MTMFAGKFVGLGRERTKTNRIYSIELREGSAFFHLAPHMQPCAPKRTRFKRTESVPPGMPVLPASARTTGCATC
jgi:hypothetical protein